jgi:hypothetical protein
MSYNLFLDDVRDPNKTFMDVLTWVVVKNYNEFVYTITQRGLPGFISFDHDLANEHYESNDSTKFTSKTGYDCAKWLVEYCVKTKQKLPHWQVHSMNPVGRSNIKQLLMRFEDDKKDDY